MSDAPVEPISALARSELAAVTFIRDYLQLQFEGPDTGEFHLVSLYSPSRIHTDDTWFAGGEPGFRDALCKRIGVYVHRALTVRQQEQVVIEFADGATFALSLRAEDFQGPEAALYDHQKGHEKQIVVWRDDWREV
jgi:hypothetical protein